MKDRLEKYVRQNRELFDVREPDPSLWMKIGQSGRDAKKNRRLVWLRYAAAAAVIFAGISAGIYFLSGVKYQDPELAGLYQEIKETEIYYTNLIDQRYKELKPYLTSVPEVKEELDYDFNELDEIFLELREDLKENVGNPEVVEAMIQHYRMKVEILEQLLYQLKEKENMNYENKTEI